jgi:AcrR family transcriptional regulator
MASATSTSPQSSSAVLLRPKAGTSRYDHRLAQILAHATGVFCEKGYAGASMRDISRATGMSLAGLYHYFDSKEKLLYLIQKHTFSTIVRQLRGRLEGVNDAEQRIRIFVSNHVEYFLANQKAMKVLSHEDESLQNGYADEIAAIKREYYRICRGLVEDFQEKGSVESSIQSGDDVARRRARPIKGAVAGGNSRIAVLSLFGMMNWIYTWHNPRTDADAEVLSRQIADIFLQGICPVKRKPFKSSKKNPITRNS